MSIFVIRYTIDYSGKSVYYVRASPYDIYDVLSCPTMRDVRSKEFALIKITIGKEDGDEIYVSNDRGNEYEPDDSLLELMESEFKENERLFWDNADIPKLYICDSCNTHYLKRTKCKHCGRKIDKIDLD